MEFTITSQQILGFCTLVGSIWGVIKIMKELMKPNEDLKKKVGLHEEYLKNDDIRLKEIEESNKLVLQSLLMLINHNITGNGIDGLKKTRDNLNDYLINK